MKHYTGIPIIILVFALTLAGCSPAEQVTPIPEDGEIQDFGAVISATAATAASIANLFITISPRSHPQCRWRANGLYGARFRA